MTTKTPTPAKTLAPQTSAPKAASSAKPDTFNTLAGLGIAVAVAFVGISKVSEAVAESAWYKDTFNTMSPPEPRCELATNGKAARAAVYAKDSDGHERLEQTSGTLRNEAGQVPVVGLKGVFMSKDVNTAYSTAKIVTDDEGIMSILTSSRDEVTPYAVQDTHTQVTITGWNGEKPIGTCSYINKKAGVGDVWKGIPLERSGLNYF